MDTTLQDPSPAFGRGDPMLGHVLDGRYRVDARIAVGGMATVYRAVDTRLDRVLALKVMHPSLATDVSFVERFIREAKSVARLAHPNVVGVFDQGADGAYVYLAMEYVAGCTLRDVLRDRGALRPRAALDILEAVLAALGAAHRAGFVHRDMKPENVLIGDDGRVKVADFGLVRAVDTVTSTTGTLLGTVSYLAPEQIEDGTATPGVDVYACGVVLYEMLTGAKPHPGDTPAQVLYRHLNEDVPPPSDVVPGLPPALDRLVASATARDPRARPHDAVALLGHVLEARAALTEAELDTDPPGAREVPHAGADDRTSVLPGAVQQPLPAEADGVHRTSLLQSPPPPPPARRRRTGGRPRRGTFAVVAALLLVLGVGAGVWYINAGQFTQVPSLLAKTEAQAKQRLDAAGLHPGGTTAYQYSDAYERGTVMATDPEANARIRDDGTVQLTVSKGPKTVKVPDVAGSRLSEAKSDLKDRGLEPGMVTKEFSEETDKGSVVRTDPKAGTVRATGSAVALVVSKGAPVDVPDVTGESEDDAVAEIEDAGLKAEIATARVTSDEDEGDVARQSPADGRLAEGDTVTLTISKGPPMIEVPDVTGLSVDDAHAKLEDAGFDVDEDRGLLGLFGDTVKSQSVEGGEKAAKGSTIKITIR
ncbi:Stk1 family PASTA domain-containing Ser/Thr kinase [Streptomyces sp. NPDC049813]|uniref:Stk1 family PASTA domain-containing Ser/Thr kinase n=1 Tax=Streptomyces sp. NPDC049813 TaxID=3365597 RepID=UPI0037B6306D